MGSSRKVIGIALLNEVLAGVFRTSGFTIVGYQCSQCLFGCFSVFYSLSFFFFHLYFVVEGRLPKTGNSHSVEIGNERAQGFGTSLELEENS